MPILKKNTKSKLNTVRKFSRNLLLMSMVSLPMIGQAATPVSLGGAFTVNTETQGGQHSAQIASLSNGNNLIYWYSSYDFEAKKPGLFAQIYTPDGLKVGTELTLNAEDGKIVALDDGGFLLVRLIYIESPSPFPEKEFSVQRYNSEGVPQGSAITFSPNEGENVYIGQINSFDIKRISNNRVLITIDGNQIYQQILNIGGVITAEAPTLVSQYQHSGHGESVSTSLPNGDYVVSWVKSSEYNSYNYSTYVQIYDANGNPKGDMFTVGPSYSNLTFTPSITTLVDGGFVLIRPINDGSIHAYLYTSEGVSKGPAITIMEPSHTHGMFNTKVAPLLDGRFVVAWTAGIDHGTENLYAQAYNPDGTKSGERIMVAPTGWVEPAISSVNHNHLIISWGSGSELGAHFENNVVAQLFKLDAQPANKLIATTPTRSIFVGNTFEIPLSIEGTNIYGVDTVLSMNGTQVAQFSDGLYGEFLPTYERLTIPVNVTGERWESALSLKSPYKAKTGKGHYGTASLIATNPGTVTVTVQSQFTDENGQYIYQSQDNYTVTVLESVLISGSVASLAPDGDFSNFTITINGEIVKINPDGSFSVQAGIGEATLTFSAPGYLSKEQSITLSPNQANVDLGEIDLVAGDSNGNDKIDIGDLTKLLGAYRTTSTDPNYSIGVDFNRDNKVDLQDLTLLGKNFGKQAQ